MRFAVLVPVVLALGACRPAIPEDVCPAESIPWDFANDFDRQAHLLRCERVPELCGRPVTSRIAEPDLERAIDIVFVADGYTEATLPAFRARADALREGLLADPKGIVGRDPSLFNFHRVDVVSRGAALEERALHTCAQALDGTWLAVGESFSVVRAAANAPDADFIMVLVDRAGGWREGVTEPVVGAPIIFVDRDMAPRTITHELGHALVGLEDEYEELDAGYPTVVAHTRARRRPNLSLSADETWDGLVSGALEGGGRASSGIYRPTNHCVMKDPFQETDFCPVCSQAVDAMLVGRRGAPAGPPQCGLWVGRDRQLTAFARDPGGVKTLSFTVNGAQLGPDFDLASLNPLLKRRPLFPENSTSVSAGANVVVTCVDSDGERSSATLTIE